MNYCTLITTSLYSPHYNQSLFNFIDKTQIILIATKPLQHLTSMSLQRQKNMLWHNTGTYTKIKGLHESAMHIEN